MSLKGVEGGSERKGWRTRAGALCLIASGLLLSGCAPKGAAIPFPFDSPSALTSAETQQHTDLIKAVETKVSDYATSLDNLQRQKNIKPVTTTVADNPSTAFNIPGMDQAHNDQNHTSTTFYINYQATIIRASDSGKVIEVDMLETASTTSIGDAIVRGTHVYNFSAKLQGDDWNLVLQYSPLNDKLPDIDGSYTTTPDQYNTIPLQTLSDLSTPQEYLEHASVPNPKLYVPDGTHL